ncbi:hypothetical protein M404DRAFT_452590 [Pisolithus tinctorius Marx 270]|uniref:Uncharacterized protein n=1 Tax=Pisolithus tinctorius Marx 270 TaxID=870435 RepID=A0A0C3PXZ5_PISTI|nr:hypothetical protein M404DRAFT_452590 [Pisolithus tinctorius Marx 270]
MLCALFGPSIFCRTPQEHLESQWRRNIQLPPTPPERHVRVYLFLEWQEGQDDKELLDGLLYLKADVPLEPTGKLSLLRIRAMWGLENCIVSLFVLFRSSTFHFDGPGNGLANRPISTYGFQSSPPSLPVAYCYWGARRRKRRAEVV